ncbi:MAG: hypothetical protein JSU66_17395 [Deltaproteobacteria bacterium]|nr:MAG: hypothetical protein JSU66_17395 [Deltaproteobacteria bacterium]
MQTSSGDARDLRLTYSRDELLDSGRYDAPLIANGVRCHGGFDADGAYRSPRTRHRAPAIESWQARVIGEGGALIEIDPARIPPQYPNVEQAKLLLREGVRDPIVRALTIISIVEGFGAVIRDVRVPDLERLVVEPVDGLALAHLGRGLFEAHARDEAGYRDEGGHKQMWEAARDLALERPKIPSDVLMRLMGRRPGTRSRERRFPQIDADLEAMLTTMATVLVVEVFAYDTFAWGMRLLSDPEVSADPEGAGNMVSYIRSDENPHVEYLRTALSELRLRTIRTEDGGTLPGREVVDGLLHRTLHTLTTERPQSQREELRASLAEAMQVARNPADLLERFDALQTHWKPPERTGFEPAADRNAGA